MYSISNSYYYDIKTDAHISKSTVFFVPDVTTQKFWSWKDLEIAGNLIIFHIVLGIR